MPQSLAKLYTHLVFSTKNRQNFIDDTIRLKLHAYMAGILNQHGSPCLLINSMPDHVHILFLLSRTMSISETVKVLKSGATSWVHTEFPKRADFLWQAGYAAFSVSQSAVDKVSEYIHTQKERHENRTFQNELRAMLRKHHIEYDERYLWD